LDLPLVTFVCVYAVMILGRVPGLAIDRTGACLLGAIVLLAGGSLGSDRAWRAIDASTIGLLLGMMLVSAQFGASGVYERATRWLASRPTTPSRLLAEVLVFVGVASALLTNDVVCLATAPVLADVCVRRGLDPVPFLLGLAAAANVGSAATLIGNPQNMLAAQHLEMSFAGYLLDGVPPAVLGLWFVHFFLVRHYRGSWERAMPFPVVVPIAFDRWQATKAGAVLGVLVVGLLVLDVPREVQALLAGGVLLVSRRTTTATLLARVDWSLLVLFAGLFVVNAAFADAGHAARGLTWLQSHGVDVRQPVELFAVSAIASNVVSNVPLMMLLLPAAEHPLSGSILALATTLAGNLLLVGSIANLIVVEAALRLGIRPRTRRWANEHWRTGVPITLATLAVAAGWLWLRHGVLA
jgi:Na+/H+ antiporter NhaD/arsenite permease-like protein